MQQLLQAMINTLNQPWEPQVKNSEQNLANIPTFTGGNQDPVEWLEAIDRAFKANKIVGAKRLFVVSAYLTGLAASWWENRRNQEPRILIWSNELAPIQGFVQQFRRVREPAQMFVQGLRPDLSLAVGPVMLNTIQEAIEKARMCELTFAHSVAACGPASIYNTVTNPVTTQFLVPQQGHYSWNCPNVNHTSAQGNEQILTTGSQDDAPLESECASMSKNPSVEELMEVYTTKRRKDNAGKAVEVPDLSEEETRKKERMMSRKESLNRTDDQYTTSMYCESQFNGEPIILILDSGSSGCVVSARFLKKAGILIDLPSTVMMIGVHVKQKRNDWMKKARARLDWKAYKKTGNKDMDVDSCESEEEEEIESDDESENDECEEENLLAQLYLCCEFQLVEEQVRERCEQCLKEGHKKGNCVLRKNPDDWTICLTGEIKEEDKTFNLREMTGIQKELMRGLLDKYRNIFAREPTQLGRMTVMQHEIHMEE
ncbi:hypothetical protein C2G38_2202511 [Gigaspora rosea]|uniref:Retrotransposon gag domain-containing protein n=1 Tax=Gigaspora rosea TaxID=44941 RepID=A0A397UW85_9GLOM|nr:hypothetical protein C2G38_2202511 [Gigaspora rosea]